MKMHWPRLTVVALAFAVAILVALLHTGPVVAQDGTGMPQRDSQAEQEILDNLAEIAPGAVPLFQEATEAMDAENWISAETTYQQVLTLAPGFAPALARLAYVNLMVDNLEAAVQYAQEAYDTDPDPLHQAVLARALVERGTPADIVAGYRHAQVAATALPDNPAVQTTLFLNAWANKDQDVIRQASEALLKLEPDDPTSHYFAGISAAIDSRWERAERELLLAQELGMPSDLVEETLDKGIRTQARIRRLLKGGGYSLLGWLVGLGLLAAIGVILSRLTLAAVRHEALL